MRAYKCDLCCKWYETTRERNCVVTIFCPEDGVEQYDCCPQCTQSIASMMKILQYGDDYVLNVITKEEVKDNGDTN